MAKQRRTRTQKIKASTKRQESYSTTACNKVLKQDTSSTVDSITTKSPDLTEYKNLLVSTITFVALVVVQLVINWWIVG